MSLKVSSGKSFNEIFTLFEEFLFFYQQFWPWSGSHCRWCNWNKQIVPGIVAAPRLRLQHFCLNIFKLQLVILDWNLILKVKKFVFQNFLNKKASNSHQKPPRVILSSQLTAERKKTTQEAELWFWTETRGKGQQTLTRWQCKGEVNKTKNFFWIQL